MSQVKEETPLPDGFWAYFDSIPLGDQGGFCFEQAEIEAGSRSGDGRHDHVLVASSSPDVYLVVVVDRSEESILGHHLLDLKRLYGLRD